MYSFSGVVRYSECDERSRLTVPALINYLQDTSTFHTESVGHGVRYLAEHHFAWFITNWQIAIDRMPRYCERIEVGTWGHNPRPTSMNRAFVVRGEDGQIIVRADSLWAVVDTNLMRPVRVPAGEAVYVTEEPLDVPPLQRKIRLSGEGVVQRSVPVAEYHLDTNHHVNNGQYVSMADAVVHAADEEFELARLQVQYKRAAQLGDVIVPRLHVEEAGYAVDLADEAGQSFAVVRMERRGVS